MFLRGDMTLEGCFFCKSTSTLAKVRVLARVHVEMVPQVTGSWKRPRTQAALVRLDLKVNHLVVVEIRACSEAFPAVQALERFFSLLSRNVEKNY